MTRAQFGVALVCVVVFSFLGGLVADRVLPGALAFAEGDEFPNPQTPDPYPDDDLLAFTDFGRTAKPMDTLAAHNFVLMDEQGSARAVLTMHSNEPVLQMLGSQAGTRLHIGIDRGGPRVSILAASRKTVTLNPSGLSGATGAPASSGVMLKGRPPGPVPPTRRLGTPRATPK